MKRVAISSKPVPKAKQQAMDHWVDAGSGSGQPTREDGRSAGEGTAQPVPAPVKMKRFTIDVPVALHARVKITCAQKGLNMADELRRILEKEFPAA